MSHKSEKPYDFDGFLEQLVNHGCEMESLAGWMFRGLTVYLDRAEWSGPDDDHAKSKTDQHSLPGMVLEMCEKIVRFAKGKIAATIEDSHVTHVVVGDRSRTRTLRQTLSK